VNRPVKNSTPNSISRQGGTIGLRIMLRQKRDFAERKLNI
jgi:hypothetical protein